MDRLVLIEMKKKNYLYDYRSHTGIREHVAENLPRSDVEFCKAVSVGT